MTYSQQGLRNSFAPLRPTLSHDAPLSVNTIPLHLSKSYSQLLHILKMALFPRVLQNFPHFYFQRDFFTSSPESADIRAHKGFRFRITPRVNCSATRAGTRPVPTNGGAPAKWQYRTSTFQRPRRIHQAGRRAGSK